MQAFRTAETLKRHITDCFKINAKQTIKIRKTFSKKIKSQFIIYADFESILVPEDNGKQNLNEPYTNKYQKHVACSYGYKLINLLTL